MLVFYLCYSDANIICSLSSGIRRSAFEKLASLAVKSPARDDGSELARLAQQSRTRQSDGALNGVLKDQAPTSRVPMVRRYCTCVNILRHTNGSLYRVFANSMFF